MKKFAAIALVLVMILGTAIPALADYPSYDSLLFRSSGSAASLTKDQSTRVNTAAMLILDYMVATGSMDILRNITTSGNIYIAKYGENSVDVYYRSTDGRYINLFLNQTTNKITDYGYSSSAPSSSSYTYHTVTSQSVCDRLAELIDAVLSN